MTERDPERIGAMLQGLLQPWHDAVGNPAKAQEDVLHRLLKTYSETEYGAEHGASQVDSVSDYRRAFPIGTYDDHFKPLIQRVMAGEVGLLLNEAPVGWAITRGTTGD